MAKDDFSGDVRLGDLLKVFHAHGVEIMEVENTDALSGGKTKMVQLKKGDLIDVIYADSVIYKGKAHRLARRYGVPIPDLYTPDKFKSQP